MSNFIMRDLERAVLLKQGDQSDCRCCGQRYVIPVWCFYGLCDTCFTEFDDLKMKQRAIRIFGGTGRGTERYEDVDNWIADKKEGKV